MNIFQRLLKKADVKNCKDIAKKRLQLVLIQDRMNLSTNDLSLLKNDLVNVVAKYMSIDKNDIDVSLHRDGSEVAFVANIPVSQKREIR